jgi:hypothetical protein
MAMAMATTIDRLIVPIFAFDQNQRDFYVYVAVFIPR